MQVHVHVNGSVHANPGGRWSHWGGSCSPQTFLYKIVVPAWDFSHKDQVVFDHRDLQYTAKTDLLNRQNIVVICDASLQQKYLC